MTYARLRNQVDTLIRKYDTELSVYRARPHALELCDRMADAVTPGRPNPNLTINQYALNLFNLLRDRGIRVQSHLPLCQHLEDCLEKRLLPQVNNVLRSLFPKAAAKGLIPRSIAQVHFQPRQDQKLTKIGDKSAESQNQTNHSSDNALLA